MTFNLLFNTVIYLIIVFLIIFIIKVNTNTISLNKRSKEKHKVLEESVNKEKIKGQIINQHMSLANNLEQTLFYRFFEISKELIALQKLLLNSN
jgi:hypothetical protein